MSERNELDNDDSLEVNSGVDDRNSLEVNGGVDDSNGLEVNGGVDDSNGLEVNSGADDNNGVEVNSGFDDGIGHHRNDGDDDGDENHSDDETLTLLYDAAFNRAPDSDGLSSWVSELVKTGVELRDVADNFIQSQEFISLYGDNLSDNDFVEALYENSLGRASDAAGKAGWVDQLDAGLARSDALIGFSESAEHTNLVLNSGGTTTSNSIDDNNAGHRRNDGDNDGNENHSDEETITLLYDAAFNRSPDSDGLSSWASEIVKTGVELRDVADNFIQSQEFINLYGDNLSDNDFVEALYENSLGRASDATGKAFWVDQLDAGVARSDALIGFSESDEHVALTLTGTATVDAALV